jgi:hypothetical protein
MGKGTAAAVGMGKGTAAEVISPPPPILCPSPPREYTTVQQGEGLRLGLSGQLSSAA